MKPILLSVAGNPENQDRGLVFHDGPKVVLCVADGAGGRSGGTEAATMAAEYVYHNASALDNADACVDLLRRMDAAVAKDAAAGETTCAIAVLTSEDIFGASVGDSGIWLIPSEGTHIDLTRGQQRKPFIGSGGVWPVPFHHRFQHGLLLLATDGLLKYATADRICETCRQSPIEATQRLIELVKYPSGAMPDDVTLILTKL